MKTIIEFFVQQQGENGANYGDRLTEIVNSIESNEKYARATVSIQFTSDQNGRHTCIIQYLLNEK